MDRGLNPLTWQRRHLVTWALLIAVGAVGGLVFGWFLSPFSRLAGDPATGFIAWLHYPLAWWPFVLAGAVTAGMAYYAADLLTGAR
jgi:hypothetical protein